MRFLDRFRRRKPKEPQTDWFLLYVLGSRGITATAAEIEDALKRAAERTLEVEIAYPEQLVSLGPNFELCTVELECTGADTYRLRLSALLVDGAGNLRGSGSEIGARARCWIAASELARAKGMADRAMKPGDKAWVA